MSKIRDKAIQGLKKGDTFIARRTFTKEETEEFARISRDYNPIHFDQRFTSLKNFSGPICHGLLVASLLTEVGGQIGWLASGMDMRFKRPVYFGDTVECRCTIVEMDAKGRSRAAIEMTNQRGEVVMTAYLTGIVPGEAEQAVMQEMVQEGDRTNRLRDEKYEVF